MQHLAPPADLSQLSINTIRTLAMDAVEKATCGHPGTPMALAPVVYVLWNEVLRYDPARPLWPARDRFILSCGHASMLLYAILHLADVQQCDRQGQPLGQPAVSLDQIKEFRQLHSRTPGHPEYGETTGVETTTGPLGQGVGNSVGMAIAQRWLANYFAYDGAELFNYRIYALCSDGDMMEGVGCEAASLAGHLKLANLCWIYDDNHITIEGDTSLAFSEDVGTRFRGLGWNVIHVPHANELEALRCAFSQFHQTTDRPTLIIVRSNIAWGAPHAQDTAEAHGAALGAEEVRRTKEVYGWPADAQFLVPDEVRGHFRQGLGERGRRLTEQWDAEFARFAKKCPDRAEQWQLMARGQLPSGWEADIPTFPADAKGQATRAASGKVLNAVARRIPWMVGGSADLAPSNNTLLKFEGATDYSASNPGGRNLHFGVREHAMGAALNGLALSGLRSYGGTFLVFSDYLRPALRLAALSGIPSLFIFTHDSIGLGEDGPTHQPVEHLAALRAMPRVNVVRPCDANEVAEAYRAILPITDRPTALILTRQALPTIDRTRYAPAAGVARGAYVLADAPAPKVILMGTGSEVSLCLAAYERLQQQGVAARVVSMPCWEWFEAQDAAYRQSVLPGNITARVAVEAAVRQGWDRYLGPGGRFVGMSSYGASAPYKALMNHFGITVERVVEEALAALEERSRGET
jgi:transketolase